MVKVSRFHNPACRQNLSRHRPIAARNYAGKPEAEQDTCRVAHNLPAQHRRAWLNHRRQDSLLDILPRYLERYCIARVWCTSQHSRPARYLQSRASEHHRLPSSGNSGGVQPALGRKSQRQSRCRRHNHHHVEELQHKGEMSSQENRQVGPRKLPAQGS